MIVALQDKISCGMQRQDNHSNTTGSELQDGCRQGLMADGHRMQAACCPAPETKDWRALRWVFSLARHGNSSSACVPELPMTSGCPVSVVPAAGWQSASVRKSGLRQEHGAMFDHRHNRTVLARAQHHGIHETDSNA